MNVILIFEKTNFFALLKCKHNNKINNLKFSFNSLHWFQINRLCNLMDHNSKSHAKFRIKRSATPEILKIPQHQKKAMIGFGPLIVSNGEEELRV